jgi:hypothetical protein
MRSFLSTIRNLALVSTAIIASAASTALAGPINVNSSINSGTFTGQTTTVGGGAQSLTGGVINRGINATNNVTGAVVQNNAAGIVNTSSNINSAIGSVLKTTKTGDYKAETGGKIDSNAFATQTGKATVAQTSSNGVNIGSDINSNIGFGNATVIGGNSKAVTGAIVVRGISSDNKVTIKKTQNSLNAVNTGSNLNSEAILEHNVNDASSSDAATGANINLQTVIGSDVTVDTTHDR